jgi:hypothetical protein
MPYKLHRENRQPAPATHTLPGSHIVTELPAFREVETIEKARQALDDFARQGITDVYAVGHERPELLR